MNKIIVSAVNFLFITGLTLLSLKLSNELQWPWLKVTLPFIVAGGLVVLNILVESITVIKRTIKNKSLEK